MFGKESQSDIVGEGRTFRRKTSKFWNIWPMPPKVKESRNVLFLDGIYLGRKACILICCDEVNVLGWYLCRYEHTELHNMLSGEPMKPKKWNSEVAKLLADIEALQIKIDGAYETAVYTEEIEETKRTGGKTQSLIHKVGRNKDIVAEQKHNTRW